MKKLIYCLLLLSICFVNKANAQHSIAYFKMVANGNTQVFDTLNQVMLPYNIEDTILTNRHIDSVWVDSVEFSNVTLQIKLNEIGRDLFENATQENGIFIIMYDSRLLTAVNVIQQVSGGYAGIKGGDLTVKKAVEIAKAISGKDSIVVDVQPGGYTNLAALDSALINKNYGVLEKLLHDDLLLGHSNAYFQNKNEVIEDLKTGKIVYESIFMEDLDGPYPAGDTYRIKRILKVKGTYEGFPFTVKLAVMEIWVDNYTRVQLWSRQAVKIKE